MCSLPGGGIQGGHVCSGSASVGRGGGDRRSGGQGGPLRYTASVGAAVRCGVLVIDAPCCTDDRGGGSHGIRNRRNRLQQERGGRAHVERSLQYGAVLVVMLGNRQRCDQRLAVALCGVVLLRPLCGACV